jgi:hypothetical protein
MYRAQIYIVSLALIAGLLQQTPAYAASATDFSDTLSTIKESIAANHTLTVTINDAWDESDTLTIDFPNTFNTSGFANTEPEDFDITDDGADQNLVASGGCSGTANEIEVTTVNTTTDTFTFTRCGSDGAIASGSVITIEIGTHALFGASGNDQITNQTAVENDTDALVTLAGTFGGSGSLALEIVVDNDVTVNATVDPRLTCTFAGLTTTFAALTGPVATSDTNTVITVSTNAPNGFSLSIQDEGSGSNPGLYKGSVPTYLVGSADGAFADTATLTADIDGFGVQGSTSGGSGATVTIAARYNQTGNDVGGLERIATTLASATGAVANRAVTVVHKAAVSGLAPAGSYADTLTYVCTGVF